MKVHHGALFRASSIHTATVQNIYVAGVNFILRFLSLYFKQLSRQASLLNSSCKLEPSVTNVNSYPGQVKFVDIENNVHYKDEFRPLYQCYESTVHKVHLR